MSSEGISSVELLRKKGLNATGITFDSFTDATRRNKTLINTNKRSSIDDSFNLQVINEGAMTPKVR